MAAGPRFCKRCRKKLSYDEKYGAYECLSCAFLALPEDKRFDPEIHKLKNTLRQDIQIDEFHKNLRASAKTVFFTKLILIINVFLYLGVSWASEDFKNSNAVVLLEMGANAGDKIFDGESWRVISSMFLHGGFFHLFMNMIALWVIGGIVERLLGNFSYLLVYIFSGVIGSLFSLYSHHSLAIGVGASGAIAGIFGSLVMFALQKKIPGFISASILKNAIFIIGVNAVIGLSVPQIDNAAHLGGFLGGFFMTYFIGQDLKNINKPKRRFVAVTVSIVLSICIYFLWKPIGDENKSNKPPDAKYIDAIDKFNELKKRNMVELDKLFYKYMNGQITKDEAMTGFKLKHVEFMESKKQELKKALKGYGDDAFYTYLQLYFRYYDIYFKQVRKYLETGDKRFLRKADYIKRVQVKMRPYEFK